MGTKFSTVLSSFITDEKVCLQCRDKRSYSAWSLVPGGEV